MEGKRSIGEKFLNEKHPQFMKGQKTTYSAVVKILNEALAPVHKP